jgi:transforming growth factor-beta-induced protein
MKKLTVMILVVFLFLGLTATVGTVRAEELTLTSVYDVIKEDERLTSFAALVDAAALADNLDQDGPFTIFAPTDEAFAAFEAAAIPTEATLTQILLYHVVNGNYPAPEVVEFDSLPTLLGEHVAFTVQNGEIVLNDSVKITVTDVAAANGVLHIIDTVLIPPTNALITSPHGSPDMTIAEVLADQGGFETFLALAEQAGLSSMLADNHAIYTVFAPTDEAFATMDPALLDQWMANDEELRLILLYHIVGDQLSINQLVHGQYLTTLEGRPLILSTDENLQVHVNGYPVQTFNIRASNGVVHVVDGVLTP